MFYGKLKITFVDVLGLAYLGFTGSSGLSKQAREDLGCGGTVHV